MKPRIATGASSFSSPNVDSSWCRDATTFSVALPVSTSVTCAVPHVCLTRATHDRIFCAMVSESATASSSFRHQSQAPQSARS